MKSKLQITLVVAITVMFVGLLAAPIYAQVFTKADTIRFQAKNTGFGITDIDKDGFSEILMFDDNTGFVRVFQATAANTYEFVKQWQPAPLRADGLKAEFGTVKSQIPEADFDGDGVMELYLSDTKGHSWVITPGGNVSTMFDDANWTMLHDWKLTNIFNEGGETRGNLIGDVDQDGLPDIYLAGNNFGSILDIEWEGAAGDGGAGDVTDADLYGFYTIAIDQNVDIEDGHFARPANIQLTDMDNDGLEEILAIVPWSGANKVDNLLGLYLFELDTSAAAGGLGKNDSLKLVWHEASDDVFSRGYVLTAGGTLRDRVDIDQDGLGEFLSYEQDGGQHIVYLFEATGVKDSMEIVWQFQFGSSTGQLGIAGNERGIMVTDIDGDGRQEITIIVDSEAPGTTNGFNAGHIFEWDGLDIDGTPGQGLPSTPTATFDPPRDAVNKVSLENNSVAFDVDGDNVKELILTHRGGNGTFLSIISLTSSDLSTGVTVNVEFVDEVVFPVGIDDSRLGQLPVEFSLGQNYPNPFNPSTSITYDLPASVTVSLNIYDMLGRNVITLVNEQQNSGSYVVEWNGKNSSGIQVTSGIYFYRLEAGRNAFTKKMLLLR